MDIGANMLFVGYGRLYPSWPTLTLYTIPIALNSLRLYEMLDLIKKVREAHLFLPTTGSALILRLRRRAEHGMLCAPCPGSPQSSNRRPRLRITLGP